MTSTSTQPIPTESSPSKHKTIYLKDYKAPDYWVETIDLVFDLNEDKTLVTSVIQFKRNATVADPDTPLYLYGVKLLLKSIALSGRELAHSEYIVDSESLTIAKVPASFTLTLVTEIHPESNTELTGLFRSGPIFCTQCESEGFRRITYYPDRPDCLAKFTTTIIADKKRYPVLLSNGNPVASGGSEGDPSRHWVKWEDPFLKPSYLFALVAGDLIAVEDTFLTRSNRLVILKLFIEHENLDKAAHAMKALKKAMKWDEETYGCEYDLDIYMIVAANDFNMGAMENKGLNVFNSRYILASPDTATDSDYYHIDAVVGHEYFHNWTGNRITCRDWFQLSLKEGLTVFREHHFSSDITKSPVHLIENARMIRSRQFSEDAGPMSHPVRPESYVEISNFYTVTVYEKGAEVIRMIKTLLGWETFRKGMQIYFAKHDGEAATTDDFVAAMESASNRDLTQFKRWYSQAGTPEVEVQANYDASQKTLTLTLKQSCPKTAGQPNKEPFHIPLLIGLLNQKGQDILPSGSQVLELKETTQEFKFENMSEKPVISLLRQFSAPVKVKTELTDADLAFLLAHDSDNFNRWDAGYQLTERLLFRLMDTFNKGGQLQLEEPWIKAYQAIVKADLNPEFKAQLLSFPSTSEMIENMVVADVDAIYAARTFLKKSFAESFKTELQTIYQQNQTPGRYEYTTETTGKRALKNLSLSYLLLLEDPSYQALALKQYQDANNMTDRMAALSALIQREGEAKNQVLSDFYNKWQHDPLVVNKWLTVQALSEAENTLEKVKELVKHPAFNINNPNKVYSLISAFASNPVRFHDNSGAGYTFLREMVLKLDVLNPQVAARILKALTPWKKFDTARQNKMKAELEFIFKQPKISRDIYEIVEKSLSA